MKTFCDEKQYKEYLKDVEIARQAIKESLLYPKGEILYDMYAIPSHNYPAYYLMIYKKGTVFECVYARTEIHIHQIPGAIKMYRFSEAKEAERHPAKIGKIIVGFGSVPDDLISRLEFIQDNFPEGYFYGKSGITIDGNFQAIRVFNKGIEETEFIYNDIRDNEFPEENKHLKELLNNMYLYIAETVINVGRT